LKSPRLPAFPFGREDGQVVILVVVAMSLFLFAALGLAIDGGQMYAQRQMAQAAADAAAQAGIMSILRGTNITSANPFGTGTPPIASSACTTTDARTPCVYARYNGFGGTASDTVTLSFPTTVAGVTLSSATVPAFSVTVQRTLQTGLIRFIGPSTSRITAKATAALVGTVSPDSIIVLNPSAPNAFDIGNGAALTVTGGAIAVNSSNADAATITGGATVTASAVNVVGGDSINNGGSSTPLPVTGAAAVADPLASLAPLTPGACLQTNYSAPSNTVIPSGTYCGGITVTNGVTNVTFGAGNFIINGGGLTFGGGITTSGSNLMFYLTGTNATYASVTIANGVTVTFSAPTSGTYQGILFYQNRSITSASNATFAGGANMNLSGTLYFPTTTVSFSNGVAAESNSTAIVANELSIAGGANIKYDPTGQKTGLFQNSVALVQ
jgi:Flp pilus assembly protein TadG